METTLSFTGLKKNLKEIFLVSLSPSEGLVLLQITTSDYVCVCTGRIPHAHAHVHTYTYFEYHLTPLCLVKYPRRSYSYSLVVVRL